MIELDVHLKIKLLIIIFYNGILDMQDLTEVVNPHHLEVSYVPQQIPHIPIIVPKIDLLVGEEIKT